MLKAIKEFKRPNNSTTNLRKMTSTKMTFTWQDPHEADFILTKKLLTSPPFKTKSHTILLTDASRLHGLGFALMQKPDNSDKLSLVSCAASKASQKLKLTTQ